MTHHSKLNRSFEASTRMSKDSGPAASQWMWVTLTLCLFSAAPASAASRQVSWDAVTTNADGSAISDLGGYRIFQSTVDFKRSGVFISTTAAMTDTRVTGTMTGPNATTYTMSSLSKDTTYYFRLTAYDNAGNQSGFNVTRPAPIRTDPR